ncbi:MAG TPA: hypothetical protein PK794_01300 [Armatimonadota bacterium]|nr:hypothetical protein [Armatimonadota bacterium]
MMKMWWMVWLFACLSALATPPAGTAPIVGGERAFLYGGAAKGKWLDTATVQPMLTGGERYRLYSAARFLGIGTGSAAREDGGTSPCIALTLPAGVKDGEVVVGVSGAWNALPRVPKAQDLSQKTYQDVVRELLARKGLPGAPVRLKKLWRLDLEGDGVEEVLIEAATPRAGFGRETPYKRGDYSLVLLRKVVNGTARTIPLALSYYLHDASPDLPYHAPPIIHTLQGAFDLNGDGNMEVVIRSDATAERWDSVFEIHGATPKATALSGGDWI